MAVLARAGLWIALPVPGLYAIQSWFHSAVIHSRRTGAVSEAVAIFLLAQSGILGAGVVWGRVTGLYVGSLAFGVAVLAQTFWLWWRSRPAVRALRARDELLSATG